MGVWVWVWVRVEFFSEDVVPVSLGDKGHADAGVSVFDEFGKVARGGAGDETKGCGGRVGLTVLLDGECAAELVERVMGVDGGAHGLVESEGVVEELESFDAHGLVDGFVEEMGDGAGGAAEVAVDEKGSVGRDVHGQVERGSVKGACVPEAARSGCGRGAAGVQVEREVFHLGPEGGRDGGGWWGLRGRQGQTCGRGFFFGLEIGARTLQLQDNVSARFVVVVVPALFAALFLGQIGHRGRRRRWRRRRWRSVG